MGVTTDSVLVRANELAAANVDGRVVILSPNAGSYFASGPPFGIRVIIGGFTFASNALTLPTTNNFFGFDQFGANSQNFAGPNGDRKMIHDMYLLQVKKFGENKGDWDLYNVLQTLPGEVVNRPLSESQCPLVKK